MLIDVQCEMGIHIDEEILGCFEGGVDGLIFAWIVREVPDLSPTE